MLLISYLDQVLVGYYCIEVVAVRPVPVLQICFWIGKKKLINGLRMRSSWTHPNHNNCPHTVYSFVTAIVTIVCVCTFWLFYTGRTTVLLLFATVLRHSGSIAGSWARTIVPQRGWKAWQMQWFLRLASRSRMLQPTSRAWPTLRSRLERT